MNGSTQIIRDESRWPPALTLLSALVLLEVLPSHVTRVASLGLLSDPGRGAFTDGCRRSHQGNIVWLGIERTMILLLAAAYVANTIAELADMIGVITIHPSGENAFSLLSSGVAIWVPTF